MVKHLIVGTGAQTMDGFLTLGGRLFANLADGDGIAKVRTHISQLLQVANLTVLLGSGASFDLAGPSIRRVSDAELCALVEAGGEDLTEADIEVSNALVGDRPLDLEELLGALSHALALLASAEVPLKINGSDVTSEAVAALRQKITRAIVIACDLPKDGVDLPAVLRGDPLSAHTTLLRHLTRVRRRDLSRPWIVTPNYDLVLEQAMDRDAIPYIDGFTGTIDRRFAPQTYEQDVYVPQRVGDGRILRLADLVYLVKVHGSINWTVDEATGTLRARGHSIASNDVPTVIYPSPLKETETLGYPYADLMRTFASTLSRPDTVLMSIGYGFQDAHINRLITDQFQANRTLQLFVAAPNSVGQLTPDGKSVIHSDTEIGQLAARPDMRVSALGGKAAKFTEFALNIFPQAESIEAPEATAST